MRETIERFTGYTTKKFNSLNKLTSIKLARPLEPRLEYTSREQSVRSSRIRALLDHVILFILHQSFRSETEGSVGIDNLSSLFGLICGTTSNYFRHVANALNTVLKSSADAQIV